jgi:hypothetical protein
MARRVHKAEAGVGDVLPFEGVHKENEYYQVVMGNYGVLLPDEINLETLDGLRLVKGKASVIKNRELALRIAQETGGTALHVTETYSRWTKEIEQ